MNRAWIVVCLAAVGCETVEEDLCRASDRFETFADLDGDGFGAGAPELACEVAEGFALTRTDCDDGNAQTFPGAEETCNTVDDNCDGSVDEGFPALRYYADLDGDGFGSLFPAVSTCAEAPAGFVRNADDCNDDDAAINPAAAEVCNDGADDNCDGLADDADPDTLEESKVPYYEDNDADGLGAFTRPVPQCSGRAGLVPNYHDCDDRTAAITCDPIYFVDADLDGYGAPDSRICSCPGLPGAVTNEDDCDDGDDWVNVPKDWYTDLDGDGYGAGASESFGCFPPNGVAVGPFAGDCDDSNAVISPVEEEICGDGIDQNCNGKLDCDDAACVAEAECLLPCADTGVAGAPATIELGDIAQYGNDYTIPCVYGNGDDVTVQWRAPSTGTYTFDTFGSDSRYGPSLALYNSCESNSAISCNLFSYINYPTDYYQARIQNVRLNEGDLVIIKLDSYYNYTSDAVLNITKQ